MGLASCAKPAPPPPPLPLVVVAEVQVKQMPITIESVGAVEPRETVTVRSQVVGVIEKIGFTEGDEVKAGQLLFQIDPRTFEATLNQANAALERDKAQSQNADVELARMKSLIDKKLVSQQDYDNSLTSAESLRAAVKADEAAARNADINLKYCSITAAISGRTGGLQVRKGNLVKINDSPLVTVNQIAPINVRFSVPEKYIAEIQKAKASGDLNVIARPASTMKEEVSGKLVFIDNQVDMTTGSILLKGEFPNEKRLLWPGQSTGVVLTIGTIANALVVPNTAVIPGQEGATVFVIDQNNTAESRVVKPGEQIGEEVVIDDGLKAGEKVVTEGQIRVLPGVKVQIKETQEKNGEKAK